MSRIRYDPEIGEKIFPDLTKMSPDGIKVFRVKWSDGLVSFIRGSTIADAAHKAGYTKKEVDDIISWDEDNTPFLF